MFRCWPLAFRLGALLIATEGLFAACLVPNPAYQIGEVEPAADAGPKSPVVDMLVPPADASVKPPADASVKPQSLSAGLVLHFAMDEGEGTKVTDGSGNGHEASFAAASGAWVEGRHGKALDFSKTGPLTVARSSALDGITKAVTVAVWVTHLRSVGHWTMIVSRQYQNTGEEYYGLGLLDDVPSFTTEFFVKAQSSASMPRGKWVHLAGTYDGVTHKIFVDGKLAGEGAAKRTLQPDTTPLIIGANQNYTNLSEYWKGLVDDVRVYDRALSAEEIAALATGP